MSKRFDIFARAFNADVPEGASAIAYSSLTGSAAAFAAAALAAKRRGVVVAVTTGLPEMDAVVSDLEALATEAGIRVLEFPPVIEDDDSAAAAAFNSILPGSIGGIVIQIGLLLFSLSTVSSWGYYGASCWGYLSRGSKIVTGIFNVVFVLMCIVGSIGSGALMWDIADTLNGLMAIPNLIALLLLSGTVAKLTKEYLARHKLK